MDLVIIPGCKSTLSDLAFLRAYGYDRQIKALAAAGVPIFGVCGGYQMLGRRILDPEGIDSAAGGMEGLGLLNVDTVFGPAKTVTRAKGVLLPDGPGLFTACRGLDVTGYEIHHGWSEGTTLEPLLEIRRQVGQTLLDGCVSVNGRIAGTYLHGLFEADIFRARFIKNLHRLTASRKEIAPLPGEDRRPVLTLDQSFDALAAQVRSALDMKTIYRIIGLNPGGGRKEVRG